MKLKDIVENVLYEEKRKNLKLIYRTQIRISDLGKREEPEADVKAAETEPPEEQGAEAQPGEELAAGVISGDTGKNLLVEEEIKVSGEGELLVPETDLQDIQTIEDLLDYMTDIREDGKQIFPEVAEEIILALVGIGEGALTDLISEGDRINIDVDYGLEKDNSIGFKVNKNPGSVNLSISMKKDNQIVPTKFNVAEFNKQIIFYRNSIVG